MNYQYCFLEIQGESVKSFSENVRTCLRVHETKSEPFKTSFLSTWLESIKLTSANSSWKPVWKTCMLIFGLKSSKFFGKFWFKLISIKELAVL